MMRETKSVSHDVNDPFTARLFDSCQDAHETLLRQVAALVHRLSPGNTVPDAWTLSDLIQVQIERIARLERERVDLRRDLALTRAECDRLFNKPTAAETLPKPPEWNPTSDPP